MNKTRPGLYLMVLLILLSVWMLLDGMRVVLKKLYEIQAAQTQPCKPGEDGQR